MVDINNHVLMHTLEAFDISAFYCSIDEWLESGIFKTYFVLFCNLLPHHKARKSWYLQKV